MKQLFSLFLIVFLLSYSSRVCFAQNEFKIESSYFSPTKSTISMATADLNNDMTDDLILFDEGKNLKIKLNNASEDKWLEVDGPENMSFKWASIVVDFNNDGIKEIVCGTVADTISIFSYDYTQNEFSLYWKADRKIYIQNINAIDINTDGFLDLFLCYDNGESVIYMNDKNGSFIEESVIDFTTVPESDKSGNYGSVWVDFNEDGYLDLYLSKCRVGVEDPNDGRRINQLFINNGDGTFTNKAEEYGVAFGEQTWCADAGDLDGDGDQDLLLANHGAPIIIAVNNNGSFSKAEYTGILAEDEFWQTSLIDMDLDGLIDIVMTGNEIYYYKNLGNYNFQTAYLRHDDEIDNKGYSCTIGDYDHNGSFDIYYSQAEGYTLPGLKPDVLLLNNQEVKNHVRIYLEGTESNRDGIGSKIKWYSNNKEYVTFIKAGHSYGIMNSISPILAVNNNEKIDSIIVNWPSGITTKIIDPIMSAKYKIIENNCVTTQSFISPVDNSASCLGIDKEYKVEANNVVWMNGLENTNISINKSVALYADVNKDGCIVRTPTLFPNFQDTTTLLDTIELLDYYYPYCKGEVINITAPDALGYEWDDNTKEQSISTSVEGEYRVQLQQECNKEHILYKRIDQDVNVQWPTGDIETMNTTDIPITIQGDSIHWFETKDSEEIIHKGNTYVLPELMDIKSVYASAISFNQDSFNIGPLEPTSGFPFSELNPFLEFTVNKPIMFYSFDVFTEYEGDREFQIYKNDEIIFSKKITIKTDTTLILDIYLEPGTYKLGTNTEVNQASFGANGPYFRRSGFLKDPYPITHEEDLLILTGNGLIMNIGHYFYFNMKVRDIAKTCETDREKIVVKLINSTIEEKIENIKVLSNPVDTYINIMSDVDANIYLFQMNGIMSENITLHKGINTIDVSQLNSGIYYLMKKGEMIAKVVKI